MRFGQNPRLVFDQKMLFMTGNRRKQLDVQGSRRKEGWRKEMSCVKGAEDEDRLGETSDKRKGASLDCAPTTRFFFPEHCTQQFLADACPHSAQTTLHSMRGHMDAPQALSLKLRSGFGIFCGSRLRWVVPPTVRDASSELPVDHR